MNFLITEADNGWIVQAEGGVWVFTTLQEVGEHLIELESLREKVGQREDWETEY